jgi:hypothetical protein
MGLSVGQKILIVSKRLNGWAGDFGDVGDRASFAIPMVA